MADTSFEIQGTRVLLHDLGDGTYAIGTTTSSGAGDITIEHEGLRLKLHFTGSTQILDGITNKIYAIVVH